MSYYCETCGMPKHACRGCPDESSEAGSRAATCSAFEAWWEDYVGGAKIEAAAMKAWTEWKASTEGDGILFSLRQHIITADQAGSNEVLVKAFAAGFLAASRTVARTQSDNEGAQAGCLELSDGSVYCQHDGKANCYRCDDCPAEADERSGSANA